MKLLYKGLFAFLLLISTVEIFAQAEPPTTWLMPPKDLWAFSYQYLDLESNVTPSNDVVLANGSINAYVNSIPVVRSFAIGDRIAQVFVQEWHGAFMDGSLETVTHDQVMTFRKLVDKRLEIAPVIRVICIGHYHPV